MHSVLFLGNLTMNSITYLLFLLYKLHIYINISYNNKAIIDGNASPRHMPVLGNVHPVKIETFWFFFRDVISLLARSFYIFNR